MSNRILLLCSAIGVDSLVALHKHCQGMDINAFSSEHFTPMAIEPQILGDTAVIPIKGALQRNPPKFAAYFGVTSTDAIASAVSAAAANPHVSKILLDVDSPGGNVSGLSNLVSAVSAAAELKTVEAYASDMCCSAAYWVASKANAIYASDPNDEIGSIGVRASIMDFSEAYANEGIKVIPVTTGPLKAAGEPGTEVTDEMIASVQSKVDALFSQFEVSVMEGRGLTSEQFKAVSNGDTFFATQAQEMGLIDGIKAISEGISNASREKPRLRKASTLRFKTI